MYTMAKNKKELKINVPNPKVGQKYYFRFAGSKMYGPISSQCEKLTATYGYAYYWFTNDADGIKSSHYPISIYNIFKNQEDV